jgi:prevent-host-death family protein
MRTTGIFEAKQNFSALIDAVEAGEEVVITRHGKPVVRLLPVAPRPVVSQRQIEQAIAELDRLRARVKPGSGWRELRDEGRKY